MLDRQKKPTRDVGGQFVRWFDEFAAPFFKVSASDPSPYICGERCWQLRCEYLHQNKGFLNDEDDDASVRFHLGINCGTSVCQLDQTSAINGIMDIRIDTEQFCLRMCQAANTIYLYAALSEEEARSNSLKGKQAEILWASEQIIQTIQP